MPLSIDPRVLELLCSRLCHDLVSPVGAINNGVELMEELEGDMAGEAVGLVAESGRKAAARLRCFRLAYGAAGGQEGVPLEDGRQAAIDYLVGSKIALAWPPAGSGVVSSVPAGTVKMLLNLVLVAEEALSYGGTIEVDASAGPGAGPAQVIATGRAAAMNDAALEALNGQPDVSELTARTVHAYVTGILSQQYGMRIEVLNPGPADNHGALVLLLHMPRG